MHNEGFDNLHKALLAAVLESQGASAPAQRRDAFLNSALSEPLKRLIYKVAKESGAIRNAHIDAVKRSGLNEDQIFELVICGAIGEATRQHHAALHAVNNSAAKEANR